MRFLEGWVRTELRDGRAIEVRAVGSRSVHVIAGNVPVVPISTLLRGAITRSDVIVKVPSNDPITMGAIARTMIDMAPNHPITRHLSVAYWKGGDAAIEERIYQPQHIERLVAWGGFASIKHITKYLQPGIDLIPLEPKSSTTLIGKEALADDETMREVARRVAADVGGYDQEACTNARVMFLESGTDEAGIARANQFGRYVFQAIQDLPRTTSSGPVNFDPALKIELESIAQQRDFYRVFTERGRTEKTGAIIVSQASEQVDFPSLLYGRVANIVPVDRIEDALDSFSAATKAAGIFPDSLRTRLRDRGALMGGQSFIPIGYAISSSAGGPSDGIEPERRMCRWVVDVHADPARGRGAVDAGAGDRSFEESGRQLATAQREGYLMQYSLLGTTGLLVSRLALGTMTFTDGSKTSIALHTVEEKLADELVGRACEAGINFVDTANIYDRGGSETVLGRVLESRRNRHSARHEGGNPNRPAAHRRRAFAPQHFNVHRRQPTSAAYRLG